MATAIARGLSEPVLATDAGSGRAARRVAELGGEVPSSNAELFRRADTVFLGHRPDQLDEVPVHETVRLRLRHFASASDRPHLG